MKHANAAIPFIRRRHGALAVLLWCVLSGALVACQPSESSSTVAETEAPATADSTALAEVEPTAAPRGTETDADRDPVNEKTVTAVESTASFESPTDWIDRFGVVALRTMLEQHDTPNVLISPLSLATALTLTARGADGDTAVVFAEVLGYGIDHGERAATELAALNGQLARHNDGLTLRQANGLWLAPTLRLQPAFADAQRALFEAEIATVEFTDPSTRDLINDWFEQATGGMIPRLFETLSPATRIVLGNALYLKGRWLNAFDPEQTREASFHRAADDTIHVAMMQQRGRFLYRETDTHQAVRLLFADTDFELALILPRNGIDPATLLAASDDAEGPPPVLDTDGFRPLPGRVALPRLDLQLGGSITPVLRSLGLGPAFSAQADFGRLAEEPLALDEIVHKTALTLDETGAEAAAATAVTAVRSAPATSFAMTLDRPFLLMLRHVPSATLLFLGRIGDPNAA